jgi:hypothetical protein
MSLRLKIQTAASLTLILISVTAWIWAFRPVPMQSERIPCRQCDLAQPYEFLLQAPQWVRNGEAAPLRLILSPAGNSTAAQPVAPAPTAEGAGVGAEARLTLPGGSVDPFGAEMTALPAGGSAEFSWQVTAIQEGDLQGTLWVYFDLPASSGSGDQQKALAAFPVRFSAVSLLGMDFGFARILGGVGLLVGLALALPWWGNWLVAILKRKSP